LSQLTALQIPDLVATTLRNLGRLKFNQVAQDLQRYECFSRWMKKDKVLFQDGSGIQMNIQLSYDEDAADFVGLLDEDQTNIKDTMYLLQVPWRHVRTSWSIIYQSDILMNRGASQILNIIKPRRTNALIALAEKMESKAWGSAPSTSNTIDPYGLQYWVVPNATTGFNGGAPGSHTTVGNISPSTHSNWKNYTVRYTSVSKGDLVKKMRTAHRMVDFVSPVTVDDYRGAIGNEYRLYLPEAVLSSFEDVGEGQNENLGRDIASMDGNTRFKRNPMIWVPKLDARTDGPVYMINHNTFYPVCLKGDYLRESEAKMNPGQHNIWTMYLDTTLNFACNDRRANVICNTSG